MNLRNWLEDHWRKLFSKYGVEPTESDVYAVNYAMQVIVTMAQGSNCSIETACHLFERMIDNQMRIRYLEQQNEMLLKAVMDRGVVWNKN